MKKRNYNPLTSGYYGGRPTSKDIEVEPARSICTSGSPKYRIKQVGNRFYPQFWWLFWWFDFSHSPRNSFTSLDKAKEFIKKQEEYDNQITKVHYI